MVQVEWKGGMAFEATPPSGKTIVMDAYPDAGGHGLGPTPLEVFLASMGACSAMDVISILEKKRQKVTGYRIEIDGDRSPAGSPFPRPYTALRVKHVLVGENLDPEAVKKAVELSDEKYCSVMATLRESPPISAEWVVEEARVA